MAKKKTGLKAKAAKAQAKKKTTKKTSAGLSKELKLAIGKDIWPTERDVLFRPDRLKYVRKLIKSDGCVFCNAAQSQPGLQSLLLYKSKHSMIVLNKFPYNPGHILVLPIRHCGDLLQLTAAEYEDLHLVLRKAFEILQKSFHPSGVNIGLNHGAVAGAGLPDHLHYHLVPRWAGDLNFFPLIAETKAVPTSLEDTFQRLREVIVP